MEKTNYLIIEIVINVVAKRNIFGNTNKIIELLKQIGSKDNAIYYGREPVLTREEENDLRRVTRKYVIYFDLDVGENTEKSKFALNKYVSLKRKFMKLLKQKMEQGIISEYKVTRSWQQR